MLILRKSTTKDLQQILSMYKKAANCKDGLARKPHEINQAYVEKFLAKSTSHGLSYIACNRHQVFGEIHAYTNGLENFKHVLMNLTIAVDPDSQGKGLGRKLFSVFLSDINNEYPEITRIELATRETNKKAIQFYQSLGFVIEGRCARRVQNQDGNIVADIFMAWLRS